MSWKKWLGVGVEASPETAADPGDTETVRRIVGRLEAMDPDRARYIAAFAYVLGRVAHADMHVSDEETGAMEALVMKHGHLPEDQAVLVVEIAKSQNRLFGGTENYLVTREFRELASREQREELLRCLFAVSAADGAISTVEEKEVRLTADQLGIPHAEYVSIRSEFGKFRDVMRGLSESG